MKALFERLLDLDIKDLENILKTLQVLKSEENAKQNKKGLDRQLPTNVKNFFKSLNRQLKKLSKRNMSGEELNEALIENLPVAAYLNLEEIWKKLVLLGEIEYLCYEGRGLYSYDMYQLRSALRIVSDSRSEQMINLDHTLTKELDGLSRLPKFSLHEVVKIKGMSSESQRCKRFQKKYLDIVKKETKKINAKIQSSAQDVQGLPELTTKQIIEKVNTNDKLVMNCTSSEVQVAAKKYQAFGQVKNILNDGSNTPAERIKKCRTELLKPEVKKVFFAERDEKGDFVTTLLNAFKKLDELTKGFFSKLNVQQFFKPQSELAYHEITKNLDQHDDHQTAEEQPMNTVRNFSVT